MSQVPELTPEELYGKMEAGEPLVILDVRNEEEFAEWKIEGKTLEHINIPYYAIIEEEHDALKDLPRDKEIVVVCAKGGASDYVAQMLLDTGRKAGHLKGGMLAWSQFYHPVLVYADDKMKIIQVNRYAKGCLSYAVVSRGKGLIVDPNRNVDVYLKLAQDHGFVIESVADTHLHADHITGGQRLAELTGATYYISAQEAKGTSLKFEPLERHAKIRVGDVDVEVLPIPTPGHTPGSTSFLIDNRFLLSGDTIFVGGLGRPDLGGKAREWAEDLYDTVFKTIRNIPDDCLVLPAHYGEIWEIRPDGAVAATLGEIRANNEIMRNEDRVSFTEHVAAAAVSLKPPNFEEIIAVNRGELTVGEERAIELEIGPNRCAVHHMG